MVNPRYLGKYVTGYVVPQNMLSHLEPYRINPYPAKVENKVSS
jgi:hypothetical protein